MNFHNISPDTKKEGDVENEETNPDYLTVKRGINLIGICEFEGCVAYKKGVVVNIKEDEFDLIEKEKTVICPKCNNIVLGKNVAFYYCYYNIYGTKINEKWSSRKFWKKIDNFQNIEIPFNNKININGESYEINKTSENKYTYYFFDDKIKYLKFQIKKF